MPFKGEIGWVEEIGGKDIPTEGLIKMMRIKSD
jgi:hypothetical protein